MELIVGESHRHGSYSGESRSIQLYPACLLWCLWLREWCMIQTTYSPGPGYLGGQKREEIVNPAQHTCSVPPASFFTDCTGSRHLAALGTMGFHVLVPFLILNAVVWACVHLRHHRMQFECTLPWAQCVCVYLTISEQDQMMMCMLYLQILGSLRTIFAWPGETDSGDEYVWGKSRQHFSFLDIVLGFFMLSCFKLWCGKGIGRYGEIEEAVWRSCSHIIPQPLDVMGT